MSPEQSDPMSVKISRVNPNNIAVVNKAKLKQQCDIYEQSPKMAPMILAQNELTTVQTWNDNTDLNIRNFIQQRAQKRMREIHNEVELAKPKIFSVPGEIEQNTIQVETAYLR